MAMEAADIERLIRAAFPTARVEITDLAGDGNHYAATVTAEEFRGLNRVQAAPDGLCRAEGEDGRVAGRAACARADDQGTGVG